ncbi:MAG TPA: hypothetical protein VMG11_12485 [Steroidobacteraceae bacterium]|nr:hypothetical protein [Steroidobacteraceae bacterium]
MLQRCAGALLLGLPLITLAQNTPPSPAADASIEQRLERLEERQKELERELQQKDAKIQELQKQHAPQAAPSNPTLPAASSQNGTAASAAPAQGTTAQGTTAQGTTTAASVSAAAPAPHKTWGYYTPNLGFKVVDTDRGDMNVSIYTYVRYLNQKDLDATYTDAFGNVKSVQQRQDVQLNKVQIKFLGWLLDPKFRYFLYAWTNNAAMGQGAQVVLAGNLNYTFNKYVTFSAGITSLPGTRSVEGNFPFWYSVDSRLMADEFFRPSYTSGFWVRGQITDTIKYQSMLGNNLSTLGVSAAQLDNRFNTWANALIWEPLGDFGLGSGDFEDHEQLAARLAAHYTRSTEDKQSQPNTDGFENTQIRLADGTVVFTPNIFGPGVTINSLQYQMTAADLGLKYRGWSLDGEYFMRWLNHFSGPGTADLSTLYDHGFQLQASYMLVPKAVQLYVGGSTVEGGTYGNPWDFRTGINYFPFNNKVVRWDTELLWLHKSATGSTALPYPVGGSGFVFHTTIEMAL